MFLHCQVCYREHNTVWGVPNVFVNPRRCLLILAILHVQKAVLSPFLYLRHSKSNLATGSVYSIIIIMYQLYSTVMTWHIKARCVSGIRISCQVLAPDKFRELQGVSGQEIISDICIQPDTVLGYNYKKAL